MADFWPAFEFIHSLEGRWVDHAADPGGKTKFGISARSYPELDIASLTLEEAAEIYRRDWWLPNRYDEIDDQEIANRVLALAINRPLRTAHRIAQRACNRVGWSLVVDGLLGPKSLSAINRSDPASLVGALKREAAEGYLKLAESRQDRRGEQLLEHPFIMGWLARAYS